MKDFLNDYSLLVFEGLQHRGHSLFAEFRHWGSLACCLLILLQDLWNYKVLLQHQKKGKLSTTGVGAFFVTNLSRGSTETQQHYIYISIYSHQAARLGMDLFPSTTVSHFQTPPSILVCCTQHSCSTSVHAKHFTYITLLLSLQLPCKVSQYYRPHIAIGGMKLWLCVA